MLPTVLDALHRTLFVLWFIPCHMLVLE